MDLIRCKDYLLQTHLAALNRGERANAYCLQSSPGVGKTEAQGQYVEMLVQALNQPVAMIVFMLATVTSPDIRGFMIPTKNPAGGAPLTVFSMPPWMPRPDGTNIYVCVPTGDPDDPVRWYDIGQWDGPRPEVGVLVLDEWGQADEDVKKPAAELQLNGRCGDWSLPRDYRVVSCTNKTTDRSGVLREMMFIVNRRGLLNIEPRLQPWERWVETQRGHKRPHYLTVSFARANPGIVFRDGVPESSEQFCSPRSLVLMDKDLRGVRTAAQEERGELLDLNDPVAHECVAAWIGAAAGGQFLAHLKYADQLPHPDDIVKNPMTAKLPPRQDGQMVCAFKLIEHISEENVTPFLKYIGRMHQDMGVLAITSINADPRRARFVFPTAEYRDWQRKNKQVILAAHGS
jgi:hypothetical protein